MPTRKKTKAQKQAQYERIMNRLNITDSENYGPVKPNDEFHGALERNYIAKEGKRYKTYKAWLKRQKRGEVKASLERARLGKMAVEAANRMGLNTRLKRVPDGKPESTKVVAAGGKG